MLNQVLLHVPEQGTWLDFRAPERVLIATEPAQILKTLDEISAACAAGQYAAGYLSFEAAAGLEPAIAVRPEADLPLAVFGIFDAPARLPGPHLAASRRASVHRAAEKPRTAENAWRADEGYTEYQQKIERIRREIGAGSLYQANYTIRLQGTGIDPQDLFDSAASSAPYAAYLDLDEFAIVSASPELFFCLDDSCIVSSPMKGTAVRGMTPHDDRQQMRWLRESAKDRAENLMITDMVRNDIGRIASTGSVRAERIFELHRLPTVWQMTSTVRATTTASLSEIFRALFPAASITGAPKIASLRLIQELEESPRGVYTGAIGYVSPDHGGRQAQFNVAIRTATVAKSSGQSSYGIGGGIVWDSEAKAEYFGIPVARPALRHALDRAAAGFQESAPEAARRIRLLVDQQGAVEVDSLPIKITQGVVQSVMLAHLPNGTENPFRYHKNTQRSLYERSKKGLPADVEPLLWNSAGFVTESTIANVVFEIAGQRYTPPLDHGLLPGVLRQMLLDDGSITERALSVGDLTEVDGLYLINSLRGWRQARLLDQVS